MIYNIYKEEVEPASQEKEERKKEGIEAVIKFNFSTSLLLLYYFLSLLLGCTALVYFTSTTGAVG